MDLVFLRSRRGGFGETDFPFQLLPGYPLSGTTPRLMVLACL